LSGANRSRACYRIVNYRRERNCRADYNFNFIITNVTCAAIKYEPIDVSYDIVAGFEQKRLSRTGTLQVNGIAHTLPVNTCLKAHVVTLRAVARYYPNGNAGRTGEERKPFIVVQYVLVTTGEILLRVVVVDGIAIAAETLGYLQLQENAI